MGNLRPEIKILIVPLVQNDAVKPPIDLEVDVACCANLVSIGRVDLIVEIEQLFKVIPEAGLRRRVWAIGALPEEAAIGQFELSNDSRWRPGPGCRLPDELATCVNPDWPCGLGGPAVRRARHLSQVDGPHCEVFFPLQRFFSCVDGGGRRSERRGENPSGS